MPRIKKPIPFCLPSNYNVLNGYLATHKTELYRHVLDSLLYGVHTDAPSTLVFTFDSSSYTIAIPREDYKENIEYLFETFITDERYEFCTKINKIKNKYGSKKTPTRKTKLPAK